MMWTDIKQIYSSIWAFALACPILFAIPVVVEFIQHAVEMQAGMYTGPEGAIAAENEPSRMQFGMLKVLSLLLPGYWLVRFMMFDRSAILARSIQWPAIGLFAVLFALNGAMSAFTLFGPDVSALLGLEDTAETTFNVVSAIVLQIITIYLFAWFVAWPLGNGAIGPFRSAQIMQGSFFYSVGLFLAGVLPLMVVHYALSAAAIITGGPAFDWTIMAVDSAVVGFLALSMVASSVIAARNAASRKGVSLLPEGTDKPQTA